MRINLRCSFAEKGQVKALGARWDPQKKTWYIENPKDLAPFAKWLDASAAGAAHAATRSVMKVPAAELVPPPSCGCDVLPWDHCEHSRALEAG